MSNEMKTGCPIIDAKGMECLVKAQTERIQELERELAQAKQMAELAKLDTKDIIRAISETFNKDAVRRCYVMRMAEQISETCDLMEESDDDIFNQMIWHMLDCIDFAGTLGVDVNHVDVLEKYSRDIEVRKSINGVIRDTIVRVIERPRDKAIFVLLDQLSYAHPR